MERILALDVGERKIGVAVNDPLGLTAQGVTVIRRGKLDEDIRQLQLIVDRYQVREVVVGLPLNMNGTKGPQAERSEEFGQLLQDRLGLEVVFVDERLSSAAAERVLLAGDASRKKRKSVIDMLAAQMILETYLPRKNRQ